MLRGGLRRLGVVASTAAFTGAVANDAHCRALDLDSASVKKLKTSLAAALAADAKPPVARREARTVYFGVNPDDPNENRGADPIRPPIELISSGFVTTSARTRRW